MSLRESTAFCAIRARSSTDTSDRSQQGSWASLAHDKKSNEKKKDSNLQEMRTWHRYRSPSLCLESWPV